MAWSSRSREAFAALAKGDGRLLTTLVPTDPAWEWGKISPAFALAFDGPAESADACGKPTRLCTKPRDRAQFGW